MGPRFIIEGARTALSPIIVGVSETRLAEKIAPRDVLLSIVIPCYNEEESIPDLLKAVPFHDILGENYRDNRGAAQRLYRDTSGESEGARS